MPAYGSVAGVAARAGREVPTAQDHPSDTVVSGWLDEAEAELLGAIQQAGGPASFAVDTRGWLQVRAKVELYVSGLLRIAHAGAGGDGGNNDGQDLRDAWVAYLERLRTNAGNLLAGYDAVGAQPRASIRMGSHSTDTTLALSAADVAPLFTIDKGRHGGNF